MVFFSDVFEADLVALGLRIVPVAADGNCFFRAIAHQIEGKEQEHTKYREMVVEYIMEHREQFEPFVEDDVNFDEYCKKMKKSGTWAGHMEIQAASLVTRTNICIHKLRSPRLHITNFDNINTRTLHLSYHGEHYNSLIPLDNHDSADDGFEAQLAALGLRIVSVEADGNCFFRAIADQLQGDEKQHRRYRDRVVEYIIQHRQKFEPFVGNKVNFAEYCNRMKESGTRAGNMEIQAASLVTNTNICIHTFRSPTLYIGDFDSRKTRTLHLSYHDGHHYNSVIPLR